MTARDIDRLRTSLRRHVVERGQHVVAAVNASEDAPTLCPRCENFTKNYGEVGCRLITWDGGRADVVTRHWLASQRDPSDWTDCGACPSFFDNGSDPRLMTRRDQRALIKIRSRLITKSLEES